MLPIYGRGVILTAKVNINDCQQQVGLTFTSYITAYWQVLAYEPSMKCEQGDNLTRLSAVNECSIISWHSPTDFDDFKKMLAIAL